MLNLIDFKKLKSMKDFGKIGLMHDYEAPIKRDLAIDILKVSFSNFINKIIKKIV